MSKFTYQERQYLLLFCWTHVFSRWVIKCWVASGRPLTPKIGVGEMAGEGEQVMTPKLCCVTLW